MMLMPLFYEKNWTNGMKNGVYVLKENPTQKILDSYNEYYFHQVNNPFDPEENAGKKVEDYLNEIGIDY